MLLEKEVTMNLHYQGNPIVLEALQGDSCRALAVRFYAGETPWEIPSDAHILLQYQRSDGTGGVYDTLADGAAACSVQENKATLFLMPQLFAISGVTKLQITFLQGDAQLTSFLMEIRVLPQISPQVIEKEYVNLAQWLNDHKGPLSVDHSIYFTIKAGIVALKPEYRAAGVKNGALARNLIIPGSVNGKKVTGIAPHAFEENLILESVVIPSAVTAIPNCCFKGCKNLHTVYSASQITEIGSYAFYGTAIREAIFPSMTALGEFAFAACKKLITANVGKITSLPEAAFAACIALREIKVEKVDDAIMLTEVGQRACMKTHSLIRADFVGANLTKVCYGAFLNSGFSYDWNSLSATKEEFSVSAVPPDISLSNVVITPCENPLPTLICQKDSRWSSETVGDSDTKYGSGCLLMSFIHGYCGLNGFHLNTVEEFESIANAIQPGVLDEYDPSGTGTLTPIAEALGISLENISRRQELYDALACGKYAIVTTANGVAEYPAGHPYKIEGQTTGREHFITTGHAVLICGVRPDGKLIVADSDYGICYALPFQAFINPMWDIAILSLPDTPIYNGEASASVDSKTPIYNGEVE